MLREKKYILYFLYIFSILYLTNSSFSQAFVLNVDWRCFVNPTLSDISSFSQLDIRVGFTAGEYRLNDPQSSTTTQFLRNLNRQQQRHDLSACVNETLQRAAALINDYCLYSIQHNTEPSTIAAYDIYRDRYASNLTRHKSLIEFCNNAAKPIYLALQNRMGFDAQFYSRRYDPSRPRPPILIGETMADAAYASIPENERQLAIDLINNRCRWPQSNEKNLTLSHAVFSANFIRAYLAQARDHTSQPCLQNIRRSLLETWQEHLYRDRDERNENCRFRSETTIDTRCSPRAHDALLRMEALLSAFANPSDQQSLRHLELTTSASHPLSSRDVLAINRAINRREDCRNLDIGESVVVHDDGEQRFVGSNLPRRYVLERLNDRHQLNIRLQFQHTNTAIRTRMQQHVRGCLPEINQVLGYAPSAATRLQLAIQFESDPTTLTPINTIQITTPGSRPDAAHWPEDIPCEGILHEALHLAGLVDLYLETETARPINIDALTALLSETSNVRQMTSGRRLRRDHNNMPGDFTLIAEMIGASRAFDCRHLGSSNSIMAGGDIYQRLLTAMRRGESPQIGILEPGEIRLLTNPFCGSTNRNYLDCASTAYTSSDEAGSCPNIPNPVCQSRIETLIRQEKTDGPHSGHRQNQRLTRWLQ